MYIFVYYLSDYGGRKLNSFTDGRYFHKSGTHNNVRLHEYKVNQGSNISVTGMQNQELERKHKIRPGTPEWFQLWFSLPYLTGEKKVGK